MYWSICFSEADHCNVGDRHRYLVQSVPELLFSTPLEIYSRIQSLWLLSYFTVGPIPSSIGCLTELELPWIRGKDKENSNQGEGSTGAAVPTGSGNLVSLKTLWLADNGPTAKLPSEIGKVLSLQHLQHLDDNQMPDPFPEQVNQLSNLKLVHLSGNPLSRFPHEVKNMCGLR